MSAIEWTDETWNPTVGCSKVSPGCGMPMPGHEGETHGNCYACGVAHRGMTETHVGLTVKRPGEHIDWTGEVRCLPERLDVPLRWRKPRRVFVDSMSDLFHHLRATPAAVRFLSLEPLLGPLPSLNLDGIDWVIVGGESGPGARPMHPDWVRDIRDRCAGAGVPFFFKQWGAWAPTGPISYSYWPDEVGQLVYHRLPRPSVFEVVDNLADADRVLAVLDENHAQGLTHVGKKVAGRELDGRTWDEMPS